MPLRWLSFIRAGCALLALVLFIQLLSVAAAFTNGQDANLVLGQPGFISSAPATAASGMNGPSGVVVDPTSGKLFVVDRNNSRVLRFASGAALATGAAAEGVLGQPNFTSNAAARTAAGMNLPSGVEIDSAGRLWWWIGATAGCCVSMERPARPTARMPMACLARPISPVTPKWQPPVG